MSISLARFGKHCAVSTLIVLTTTHCADTPDGRLAQLHGYVIGGVIGFAYGSHIANKKSQYKSTEEWLDACIAQADTTRKQAVAYNQQTNRQLATLQRQVQMAKAAGDKTRLASLKREIGTAKTAAQQQVSVFSNEAAMQHTAIKQSGGTGGSRLSTLRASTSEIETQVSILNQGIQRYAELESQTDV